MQLAMIQDRILPFSDLDPIYLDRAMFFGDGVYEVLRSYNGRLFALDEHLNRFANSLRAVEIEGVDLEGVRQRVLTGFETAEIANAKVYFHITRGSAQRDLAVDPVGGHHFFMTITELPNVPEDHTQGIAAVTLPDWRWKRCDIKSLNLLANVLARRAAEKLGCREAILVDEQGWITEGASSTFFAIRSGLAPADDRNPRGDILQTAPLSANVLPSITRIFIIKAAQRIGLPVVEESLMPAQAEEALELFIAVTTQDIVPVVTFNQKRIGQGIPGRWTLKLREAFAAFTPRT